ncbi:MAG: hypothetical protein VX929_11900 [Pseudomonadota bacterium]|nr:hypothetical protein [Pseudomonadota bacterium]
MRKKYHLKPIAAALGATFAVTLAASPLANANDNPFSATAFTSGYMVADSHEGKCGEGKCGEGKAAKEKEGKCGEGKCGEGKAAQEKEGKCGEGKCGEDKAMEKEGKCGEGKCGG